MNVLTDYIGRGIVMERSDRIERIQKEFIDVFVPGMQYREMDSLMSFFTSGQSVLASYALPGDGPDSLASVLGHIPVSESAPEVGCDVGDGFDESDEVLLETFGLIEACAGIAIMSAAFEALDVSLLGWIEHDPFKMRYLWRMFPFALWCSDLISNGWRAWGWAKKVPLILVGGPPCVFASLLGV